MQTMLEEVLRVATDATSAAPVYATQKAQRADIERSAAELRASIRICLAKADTIAALLRLRAERRAA